MCGIAGIFSPPGERPSERPDLERMIHSLRHRGPDGFGYHMAPGIGLAHARLSIIDLTTGDQPIHNESGTVSVVFNGEIFNYLELRAELEARGHRFYTTSDTEVLVHLYEDFGERFVEHLNGQFAIALWDAPARRLILARDRVGIRPLFYTWSRQRLLFGSEVKAILAEGSLTPRLDAQSLIETFSYWCPLEGRSAFEGIHALPPGHLMIVEGTQSKVTCYWDWDFSNPAPPRGNHQERVEELRALLEDAVRLQLRSDVPVGAYLSGGLDSSAITSITQRITRQPVRAFSLTFEDAEFDEGDFQRLMGKALGVERTEFCCKHGDIAAAFGQAIRHVEAPMVRTAPVPLMLLAQRVREAGYKVVLTGEGADEVFAGYDLFREAKIRRWIAGNPDSAWRGRLLERLYPYLANSPTRSQAFARQFFAAGKEDPQHTAFAHLPRIRTTQRSLQFLSAGLREESRKFDAAAALADAFPRVTPAWPPLGRDQYIEAHTLMSGYLLSTQGDRMAMANSIEGRFPYLDHRVIEFACRLPPSSKLSGMREKHILKQAVAPWVPDQIRARVKQPYRSPDSQSFFAAGQPHPLVVEMLDAGRVRDAGYFDPLAVARLTEKCRSGKAIGFGDNMAFIGILSTMTLHATFIAAGTT
ncbi:MAG: asparagine synthase (glutamine-hydrolyzing) [Chromatiales bacterium]|nr:asparagine synthase (glutamine-hydrolyzing) [Chromatiales bacterium]